MARIMRIAAFLGVCVVLSSLQQANGEESKSKDRTNNRYTELISQLVSPNEKPTTKNGADSSVKFPVSYDVKAQKRIEAARQALYDDLENALPYLARALDDKRYSMTINWADGDAYYNKSVGDICLNVIEAQLEVYRDKIRFGGPGQWNRYTFPITREWLEKRKGRSLAELQVEAVQWAIDRSKELSNDKFAALDLSDEEIAELQKLRDTIAKSGKPVKRQRGGMLKMVTRDQSS